MSKADDLAILLRTSIYSAGMTWKQTAEKVIEWFESGVEYEYAVLYTAINYPHAETILNGVWVNKREDAEALMERWRKMNFHSLMDLKVVKRRKAGKVELA